MELVRDWISEENYTRNRWTSQKVVPIIYIEKDTLTDQIQRAIKDLSIVIYPTKGVTSFTKLWNLARKRRVHVLYMTDHDATGVFMGEDFRARLNEYGGESVPVTRIALTLDQVHRLQLTPNPAHKKDSRTPKYVKQFGNRTWELDAIPPDELGRIVRSAMLRFVDQKAWDSVERREKRERKTLEPKLAPIRELVQELIDEEDE